jgi:hypothetical protein
VNWSRRARRGLAAASSSWINHLTPRARPGAPGQYSLITVRTGPQAGRAWQCRAGQPTSGVGSSPARPGRPGSVSTLTVTS